MTNPAIAAIRDLLDDHEDNPRFYIAAVLDNLPRAEMAILLCCGAAGCGYAPEYRQARCYAEVSQGEGIERVISAARATLLPGDAT